MRRTRGLRHLKPQVCFFFIVFLSTTKYWQIGYAYRKTQWRHETGTTNDENGRDNEDGQTRMHQGMLLFLPSFYCPTNYIYQTTHTTEWERIMSGHHHHSRDDERGARDVHVKPHWHVFFKYFYTYYTTSRSPLSDISWNVIYIVISIYQ